MSDPRRMVFKIAGQQEWAIAVQEGQYRGSADDLRDGFIHLSSFDQVPGTLARHFSGRTDLVLAAFDEAALAQGLKWEPSRGGVLFPHFYGPLDPRSALWVEPISLGSDGRHRLPTRSRS